MPSTSRREFLQKGAWAGLLGGAVGQLQATQPVGGLLSIGPDLIVVNGTVHTVDDRPGPAEAFAIQNGRFSAVGSNTAIQALARPTTRVIDAQGMTIVPGFIDAHCHPSWGGLLELLHVDCDCRSIAEILNGIRERAAKTPAGTWITGFKYDDTKLTDGRGLTRSDLDTAAPGHAVRIIHRGMHTLVCNSLAFKLAGIDRNTPDPEGGKFGRDAAGELTGFVAEKAAAPFDKLAPWLTGTPKQRQAGVTLMSEKMAAAGLTSVHDAMTDRESFIAYQDAVASGELRFRLYAMVTPDLFQLLRAAGIRSGFGDDRLRVGGLKLVCDGSASERTMRLSTPYVGRPTDFGILVMNQENLNSAVAEAHGAGWQVGVHANGDVAIDMVLNAYELATRLHPRNDVRHRIEHCTLVNASLLKRIAALGVIPTPFYTYVYYNGDKWAQYGEERVRSMFAHRSFLDHGIPAAGASDYVPGPYEPLMAIQSMVTRQDFRGRVWGDNQRITVAEALRVCTINGARASFEETIKGSISPGKLADFVVLAEDPHKVPPDRIKDIRVVRTVVGGRTVHPKSERD